MSAVQPTLATIADYFRVGLEAGLLKPENARSWADAIITELDQPPSEIIDVSLSMSTPVLIEALNAVQGERNITLAGEWLLGLLRETLPPSDQYLSWAAQRAMHIARATGLGDEVYYRFDIIEDELFLAKNNIYGNVAECRIELEHALANYPTAPFHYEM